MILQKSFQYADLMLKKTFPLKIVVLLNIFVEKLYIFQDSWVDFQKNSVYLKKRNIL